MYGGVEDGADVLSTGESALGGRTVRVRSQGFRPSLSHTSTIGA